MNTGVSDAFWNFLGACKLPLWTRAERVGCMAGGWPLVLRECLRCASLLRPVCWAPPKVSLFWCEPRAANRAPSEGLPVRPAWSVQSVMPRSSLLTLACWLLNAATAVFLDGHEQRDVDCAACMAVGDELTRVLLKEKTQQNLNLQSHRVHNSREEPRASRTGTLCIGVLLTNGRAPVCSSLHRCRIVAPARRPRWSTTR